MPNRTIAKGRALEKAVLEAKLVKLRRENRKLRTTVDDIWNVLTDVESDGSESIETACKLISSALPVYEFIEGAFPDDASQDAAILFEDVEEQKLTRVVAAEMGLTVEEFSQSTDVDAKLMSLRRVLFKQFQWNKDPTVSLTDEEYLSLVGGFFTAAVGVASNFPLSLKAEAARFINALDIIHRGLDKRKRQPKPDVQQAFEMLEKGYTLSGQSMEAICQRAITVENGYEENYSQMLPRAKRYARGHLRKKIDSLRRTRKKRAVDAAVDLLVAGSYTLEDPQSVETICQNTITVQNGYDKNYSSMSTAKRLAARRALCREVVNAQISK